MITVQFDECSSSADIVKACKKQGLAKAKRFPNKHKSLKDPEVLSIYMSKSSVFFTFDSKLIEEHRDHIPLEHPGIVIIGHSISFLRTLTVSSAKYILGRFKKSFPEWHLVQWNNSIVKITDSTVDAMFISSQGSVRSLSRSFDVNGWQEELKTCLSTNALRRTRLR